MAAATTAIRIATTKGTFHFSLSTLTTSALATMNPEIERSKPPIRIRSVCPTDASPASEASTRICLTLPQFQKPRSIAP